MKMMGELNRIEVYNASIEVRLKAGLNHHRSNLITFRSYFSLETVSTLEAPSHHNINVGAYSFGFGGIA